MHIQIRQSCFMMVMVAFMGFAFLSTALAESTSVTSTGIKFPDGTTQTTAATGGGSSLWSQSGSDIYYNNGDVGIGTGSPRAPLNVSGPSFEYSTLGSLYPVNYDVLHVKNNDVSGTTYDPDRVVVFTLSSGDHADAHIIAGQEVSYWGSYLAFITRSGNNSGVGAVSERMRITNSGNVGIGTTSPAQKLSVAGTIEATSGGFKFPDGTTQTTAATGGGSSLWSQSGSDIYYNNGDVGIGTGSPRAPLNVSGPSFEYSTLGSLYPVNYDVLHVKNNDVSGTTYDPDRVVVFTLSSGDHADAHIIAGQEVSYWGSYLAFITRSGNNSGVGAVSERMRITNSGNVGIGTTDPAYPLEMASGAHVTAAGVWTDASSREYKENIRTLSYDEAESALSSLIPSKFNYKIDKDDEYLGFIAEDVPDLVATKDRKGLSPMDIVAVLTKVVQKQQEEIKALKNLITAKQ